MKKNIIYDIVANAFIIAIYFAISMLLLPVSYGILNIRVAEILLVLVLFNKKYAYGIVLGCFLTNVFSPLPLDMLIGTAQTIVACLCLIFIKSRYFALFFATLSCGLMIGFELTLAYEYPFYYSFLSVFVSEGIIIFLGYIFWKTILNNVRIKKMIIR